MEVVCLPGRVAWCCGCRAGCWWVIMFSFMVGLTAGFAAVGLWLWCFGLGVYGWVWAGGCWLFYVWGVCCGMAWVLWVWCWIVVL